MRCTHSTLWAATSVKLAELPEPLNRLFSPSSTTRYAHILSMLACRLTRQIYFKNQQPPEGEAKPIPGNPSARDGAVDRRRLVYVCDRTAHRGR